MQQDNTRNTIIFVVCAVAIFILYDLFVLRPSAERRQGEAQRAAASAELQADRPTAPAVAAGRVFLDRKQAAAADPRVPIETPYVRGSLNLTGARIDDLYLRRYRETIDRGSPNVELFRPEGARHAYFAEFGWTGDNPATLPGPDTRWTVVQGGRLTPSTPITLAYDNGAGLVFTRRIAVDNRYMFTVSDTVVNRGAAPVRLASYGSVQRQGFPPGFLNNQILHEGAIGVLAERLEMIKFNKWRERDVPLRRNSEGGWIGVTDKYWLAALIPNQETPVTAAFKRTPSGGLNVFEANYTGPGLELRPATQTTAVSHLFAGAKQVEVLDAYERSHGVPRFDSAVDWGNLWFLTKPIFYFLHWIQQNVGSFGVAILLLTVVMKAIFFPLANKSYASFAKLKKLAPKVEELKKRYPKDPQKQQQEMLALYQKEGANPIAGCLPILLQIPVFYALYKVLSVTLEMRHADFVGWVDDLSARDPTSMLNLFGLIPWNPATTPMIGELLGGPLHIGAWPLLYGLAMWLQQGMQPMSADPIQKRIFQFFPIIFTFIIAPLAVGLVIYWTWSTLLGILQQWVIMRRYKAENPIDTFLARISGKPAASG